METYEELEKISEEIQEDFRITDEEFKAFKEFHDPNKPLRKWGWLIGGTFFLILGIILVVVFYYSQIVDLIFYGIVLISSGLCSIGFNDLVFLMY